jgi:L-cysteine:1D-myo-inositol 2-amino-2-deoxy-alpha-D-glucopyranoside ligase
MNSWASVDIPPLADRFTLPQLSLFDSASQSVKGLEKKDLYRMYVCGITPYDATHLGHAATYLTFDLINRYLRASGAEVLFVQNITDIDDPLLERAHRDGVDWKELAESQINLFRGDMVNLHILPPAHYIGVVEAMPLVTKAIEKLSAAETTYAIEDDLYFRTHSDPRFGSRSHLSQEEMLKIFSARGGDPSRSGKENPLDSLLWLGHKPGEPSWPSSLGEGRPGWHIECCAIALHYLDTENTLETAIDIQGGGSDLIFPHHEMSATQTYVLQGREFASHYVHSGMIGLDGEKMSKSLGNLVFVSTLISHGVNPMAIRWALMSSHFASDRMWSNDLLDEVSNWIERLERALSREVVSDTDSVINEIIDSLANNLDTPRALHALCRWIESTESDATGGTPGELSRAIDSLLGLAL